MINRNIFKMKASYFVSALSIEKKMYESTDDRIDIIYKDGTIKKHCRSTGYAKLLLAL